MVVLFCFIVYCGDAVVGIWVWVVMLVDCVWLFV